MVRSTHLVDRAGVSRAAYLVSTQLGWLFREQETSDIGIDAHLEVVDDASLVAGSLGRGTGRLLAVQIKSGTSQFASPTDGGWWFYCDANHVEYWINHSLPVVVMLFEPATEQIYWQHVNAGTLVPTGKRYKILVPSGQRLDRSSSHALSLPARERIETRDAYVRRADHELARAIDLLTAGLGKSPLEADRREFRLAFAAQLRALHRLAGAPEINIMAQRIGYDESRLQDCLSGKILPGRARIVAIVQALIKYAGENQREIPDHLLDVRCWERMWRVADRPGMQKIVRNKALKGSENLIRPADQPNGWR